MRIYRKYLERITIIGPKEEREKALDYCYDNGFRVTWLGPKRIGKRKLDFSKFRIVAEREVVRP